MEKGKKTKNHHEDEIMSKEYFQQEFMEYAKEILQGVEDVLKESVKEDFLNVVERCKTYGVDENTIFHMVIKLLDLNYMNDIRRSEATSGLMRAMNDYLTTRENNFKLQKYEVVDATYVEIVKAALEKYPRATDKNIIELLRRVNLSEVLLNLDNDQHAIITMSYYNRVKRIEICKELNIDTAKYYRLMTNALKRIRSEIVPVFLEIAYPLEELTENSSIEDIYPYISRRTYSILTHDGRTHTLSDIRKAADPETKKLHIQGCGAASTKELNDFFAEKLGKPLFE